MRYILFILTASLLFPVSPAFAQTGDVRVLLTVDRHETTVDEFMWMYNKNNNGDSKMSLEDYLDGFINFRLKVAAAARAGIDTTRAFKDELRGYRTLLARSYLTDETVKEKLIGEAYKKSLTEVNASHILVTLSPQASPADTMAAWDRIMNIRMRLIAGEPFDEVARGSSDDPSVVMNGGNLGYFTLFQLNTDFEAAAYRQKPGVLSMPVRTPFGYHLILVNSRRNAAGRFKTAHIMKIIPPGAPLSVEEKAKKEIDSLYALLKGGANFEDIARNASDHKESAVNGGELPWFGTGEMIKEYADPVAELKKNGDYTAPVRSYYGYHIIKRLDHKPHPPIDELRSFIEVRLGENLITTEGRRSLAEKLKKEYNYKLNRESYDWFASSVTAPVLAGDSCLSTADVPSGFIFSFAGGRTTNSDFARYLCNRRKYSDSEVAISNLREAVDEVATEKLLEYEDKNLEKKYPSFRYLVNEFHDGIMLFEITQEKVWHKAQNDTAALLEYYNNNRKKYLLADRLEGIMVTPGPKLKVKKVQRAIGRISDKSDAENQLMMIFGDDPKKGISITEMKYTKGEDTIPEFIRWSEGTYTGKSNGVNSLFLVRNIVKDKIKPFDEVQGLVISAYQELLERDWIEQLKKEYIVKVNNTILEELKK